MLNVEAIKHAVLESLEIDIFAVARKIAMVGKGVEARTWATGFDRQSARGSEKLTAKCSIGSGSQSSGPGAIHFFGTNARVDRY